MNGLSTESMPSRQRLEELPAVNVSRGSATQRLASPLEPFFCPQSIAVIGGSERQGSIGRTILTNLISGDFGGPIYIVNPRHKKVLEVPTYESILSIDNTVDLAIIITPAITVPRVVEECAQAGVKSAIIVSAGFRECGPSGREFETQIGEKRGSMRIIGPNCLGIMVPRYGLNATFANRMALDGNVGFISQSGALGAAILDWSKREKVGFSAFVSVGSMLDVKWGDLVYYLGDDPKTTSIVLYMESIGDARSFLSAAREVALTKPIVVIKVGQSEKAAPAAASHIESMTDSEEVLDAAFRRAGVLRVDTISELFAMAEVLGKQPRPQGPRLAIVTNGGGPDVLATSALIKGGGQVAHLSQGSVEALNAILPQHWSKRNPVDLLGDADADRYAKAVEIISHDPHNDGILVVLTPQAMTQGSVTAINLQKFAHLSGKPILASWMGGDFVADGVRILNDADIPTFAYPDTAATVFCYMWRYAENLRSLYETPTLDEKVDDAHQRVEAVRNAIIATLDEGRTLLSEVESKNILSAYDIPVVESHIAKSAEEAIHIADRIGYPVVLKVHSKSLTHRNDVGGVKLGLQTGHDVMDASYRIKTAITKEAGKESFLGVIVQPMISRKGLELIVGSSIDDQFGPVLLFGAGGPSAETLKDRSLGLPPLNATLARRMIERTKIFGALRGARGNTQISMHHLEQFMVRFSELVVNHPEIKEIELNPLLVSGGTMLALDARVILHEPFLEDDELPKPAIRPYPAQYITSATLRNGCHIMLRPIRPEDEPLLAEFHKTLSLNTVHSRYFHPYKLESRVAHDRLVRICFIDYDREIAIVAEHSLPNGGREILGVARLIKIHGLD